MDLDREWAYATAMLCGVAACWTWAGMVLLEEYGGF